MAYSKGRARAYSEFYKDNSDTASDVYGSEDDEEIKDPRAATPLKRAMTPVKKTVDADERRKAALRRRLQMRKAGS